MVESQPSKLLVAGSIPVSRSIRLRTRDVRACYGGMPRRSAEGAEVGNLRALRELRLASQPSLATRATVGKPSGWVRAGW